MSITMRKASIISETNSQVMKHYVTVSTGCCGDTTHDNLTRKGQRYQMIKILCLTLIPIIVLSIITTMSVVENTPDYAAKDRLRQAIRLSLQIGNVIHYAQLERGTSVMYISSNADAVIYDKLQQIYQHTDHAVQQLTLWPEVSSNDPVHFKSKNTYSAKVHEYRNLVMGNKTTLKQIISLYTNDNLIIIGWLSRYIDMAVSDHLWKTLVSYHVLLLAKDEAGIERALGSHYYAAGYFTKEMLIWYVEKKITVERYLLLCTEYSTIIGTILKERLYDRDLSEHLNDMRQEIINNSIHSESSYSSLLWFDNMTSYINILKEIQDTIGENILKALAEELDVVNTNYNISIGLLSGAVLLYPAIMLVVFKITKKMQTVALSLKEQTFLLSRERKRSEALLCEMLPVSVAKKLMMNESVEPRLYESATVFFSDIVGFTTICSRCTPLEVVDMLNHLYKTFDSILGEYDVYKVETIGDAYMVVSGIPERNGEYHVSEISLMALDILETSARLKIPQLKQNDNGMDVRVGINTGPVVSGIVGLKMPRYCLFGDTVNVASRMESTGKPQQIQITEATAKALEKHNCFKIQKRGVLEIKGKGLMTTYWLLPSGSLSEQRHREQRRRDTKHIFIETIEPSALSTECM